jgi:hypothetical protein
MTGGEVVESFAFSILGLGRWAPAESLARAVERFQLRRR